MVAAIIFAMVKDERFENAIKEKIGCAVDTAYLEHHLQLPGSDWRESYP